MKPFAIIDRGRGPEIAGSRITVYDVLAETQAGATPEQLAEWYELDVAQIELALRYIDEHKEEVVRAYEEIRARHARGNPPEVEARLVNSPSHALIQARWAELQRRRADDPLDALVRAALLSAQDDDVRAWLSNLLDAPTVTDRNDDEQQLAT